MSSPPAIPMYNGYPALNGYPPQINGGVDPEKPIDFRKLQSHRRYVQRRGFHRSKIKAADKRLDPPPSYHNNC